MKTAAALIAVILCGCERRPEFPVPEQRPELPVASLPGTRVLKMDDPGVSLRFVRDISTDLTAGWRWAFKRPAVRIPVRTDEPLRYFIEFALPEITFKDTGPVTIEFTVNDRVLDRVHYTESGSHSFEKLVPADWMIPGQDAIIGAEIDRMWVSRVDGASYGFIITQIGLRK